MADPILPENTPAWVAIVAFVAGPFAERFIRTVMGWRKAQQDSSDAQRAYWDEKTDGFIVRLEGRIDVLEKLEKECRASNQRLSHQIARLEGALVANGIAIPDLSGEFEVANG